MESPSTGYDSYLEWHRYERGIPALGSIAAVYQQDSAGRQPVVGEGLVCATCSRGRVRSTCVCCWLYKYPAADTVASQDLTS